VVGILGLRRRGKSRHQGLAKINPTPAGPSAHTAVDRAREAPAVAESDEPMPNSGWLRPGPVVRPRASGARHGGRGRAKLTHRTEASAYDGTASRGSRERKPHNLPADSFSSETGIFGVIMLLGGSGLGRGRAGRSWQRSSGGWRVGQARRRSACVVLPPTRQRGS